MFDNIKQNDFDDTKVSISCPIKEYGPATQHFKNKKGENMNTKNGWFLASGILSILASVSYFIVMLVAIALVSVPFDQMNFDPAITEGEYFLVKSVMTTLIIVMLILMAISIFNAVVYLKFQNKSFEETKNHSGLIITVCVFSFIVGGVLIGIFGVLGYALKPETPKIVENETTENENNLPNDIKNRLEQLKDLKDSGIITEEEYNNKRNEIISNL